MINRCKFLHIVLHVCGKTNTQCQYMADPESCPNYDEDEDRGYVKKYTRKDIDEASRLESKRLMENIETDQEFVNRVESHLRSIGVEVEREEKTEEMPDDF